MTTATQTPTRYWACPSCQTVSHTDDDAPMHVCSGLDGRVALLVSVPKPDVRPDARHVLLEREVSVEELHCLVEPDRYMSVRTDHGDGHNDALVYIVPPNIDLSGMNLGAAIQVGARAAEMKARVRGMEERFHHQFHDVDLDRAAHLARKIHAEMAFSTSAIMPYTLGQCLVKAISLTADTFKAMYYNNTVVPVNTASTAATSEPNGASSAFQTANEQTTSGTGTVYTQGTGMAVNTPAVNQSTNVLTFTATSITSPLVFTTIAAGLYGMVITDQTVVVAPGMIATYNTFGGQQLVTAGTFAVTFASGFGTYTC